MWGLFFTAALLAVVMWGYNLYWDHGIVFPARVALQSQDDEAVRRSASDFLGPHLFAGYQPYTGFGPERARGVHDTARSIVSRGTDYLPREVQFLAHNPAHFVVLFQEFRVAGKMSLVPGDREVLSTVADRLENAVHTGYVFAIHLALVALILGLVLLLYYRLRLWERV